MTDTTTTNPSKPPASVMVLGIGNALRSDEGIGVHAIRELDARACLGDHVTLIDGGVMGLDLLPALEGCEALVVVDAIDAAQPPGTVLRMEGDDVPTDIIDKLSMHQAGLADLLGLLRLQGQRPPQLVLFGVQPASLDWGLELSPIGQQALQPLVAAILDQLQQWGAIKPTTPPSAPV